MDKPFLYISCQHGAENVLKTEILRETDWKFAFSRPGFLTFKAETNRETLNRSLPGLRRRLVFARTLGLSLGKIHAENAVDAAREVWKLTGEHPWFRERSPARIHVWQRDAEEPGTNRFEPGLTENDLRFHRVLWEQRPIGQRFAAGAEHLALPAGFGERVLDCISVEPDKRPNEWWIGAHDVDSKDERSVAFPGGVPPLRLPDDAVSRAWLKFEEGLHWSGFPIGVGSRCLDLGASPGGASQTLLARGAEVLGLDPGEMAPAVLHHPGFTHLRSRSGQVKRLLFQKVRWIIADMNVAPGYTLEALEELVRHPRIHVRGLLFTLKLFDWKLAGELPAYRRRIESWGYNQVKMKQLAFNRQEIMVAALQSPFQKKTPRK